MARFVRYNGIVRFKPGGITRINAEALNRVSAGLNSVVAIIGEANGGAPGAEGGLVALDDPSRASVLFRSGPIVDAIRTAFQPSNDPNVPGGASRVVIFKTNNSTKAATTLPAPAPESLIFGAATDGGALYLEDTNLGSVFPDGAFVGSYLHLRPGTATAEVRKIVAYDSGDNEFTVDVAFAANAATADDYEILSENAELVDVVNHSTSTASNLDLKAASVSDDQHNGRWVSVFVPGVGEFLRRVVDTVGSSDTLVVEPALPVTPTAGTLAKVLANAVNLEHADWGVHTNGLKIDLSSGSAPDSVVVTSSFEGKEEVSPDIGGQVLFKVLYRGGGPSVVDDVDVGSTTTVVELDNGGLTPDAWAGYQVKVGSVYTRIVTHTASALTVSPALPAAPTAGTPVEIQGVENAAMRVMGMSGKATTLVTKVDGVVGDDLSITLTPGMTLRDLVDAVTQNPNYVAHIPNGVNPDTNFAQDLDFGLRTAEIMASPQIGTEGLTRNAMALVDYLNNFSEWVRASRSSDTGSPWAGGVAPAPTPDAVAFVGGSRGTSSNSSFQEGFDELLKVRVNSVVPLIDSDLAEEGFGSTATVASVAAQLVDHVTVARGSGQEIAGERGGFIGFYGTKNQTIEFANSINDYDVAVCAQRPTILNAFGSLQEFGPRMQAIQAAGMRAGVFEVAEPLTHKLIRVSGYSQHPSWDPSDLTDANDFIRAGILFAETVEGVGTRWVRDLTTWVADDNLAFVEGSIRDAVRYVAWNLRTELVNRFTGRKASPATINNIKSTAATILNLMRDETIIVDSTDPVTGENMRAWHNLFVTSSGDTVKLNVGIFPVPGINFQLNEIFLQLPTQAA